MSDFNFLDEIDAIINSPERKELRPEDLKHTKEHIEICPKCRGTGQYRHFGPCFSCKGKGKKIFKTSRAQREKAADARAEARFRAVKAFMADYAEIVEWAQNAVNKTGFEFARNILDYGYKNGELTEKQVEACNRLIAKDKERQAARQEAKAKTNPQNLVDASRIAEMFDKARSNGLKRISVTIGEFSFSPAPAVGANPGAIYVKFRKEYAGKIKDNYFSPVRLADADKKFLCEVLADPHAAAVAHGKATGRCAICSRELTDPVSIENGIGPICEAKFF